MPPEIIVPSKNQIRKAGKFLRDLDQEPDLSALDGTKVDEALEIVQLFRAAHAYPMLKVRIGLEGFVRTTKVNGGTTQRHKRVARIVRKLRRTRDGPGGGTALDRLEDIGGCRTVVATPQELSKLAAHIRRRWSGQFVRSPRDYVAMPKDMGYRAIHFVVERDKRAIEIQLRTRGQQQWADAVEAADARWATVDGINLKDEVAPEELKNFFRTAGEMIYRREFGIALDDAFHAEFDEARRQVIAAGFYTG
ncbi:RelA/SpoT domain protein [Aeromicrobium marinum DSM 15272]|uniref:RelA/SpoT domain protein n=1 Tax=Aeromicrobium marinum DSM 15272 TaxID=585531 RepID=E2SBV1_9ACTN|nr:RelA/SpoT domain-containing protein [Aeromicrobium marinum]EFQ83237.1 RelA/SpoT domain protein [Aeromicrobium marinum DSM 15272]